MTHERVEKSMTKEKQDEAKLKAYLEERNALVQGEQKSAEQFDKGVLTLAAGALGISLVFLEKIAPHPTQASLKYLCIAWLGFALSLGTILFSFLSSQFAYRRQRDILEDELLDKPKRRNGFAGATAMLNVFAIIAFTAGAVGLAWFSITNIRQIGTP
jgi:hypothetical protein